MSVQSTEAPAAPAPETPPPAAPPAAPAATQPPAPVPQPPQPREPDGRYAPAQTPAPAPSPASPADSTDWQAEARKARAEADEARRQAEQWKAQSRRQEQRSKLNHQELQGRDALLRQIAEKLEIEFDDRPDPEVLQQRLTETASRARQSEVELAVYRQAAAAQNVNAVALLDSREFMSRTAALDPDAADFHAQLSDLVREAAGQPRYQFVQPPAPAQEPVQQQVQAQPQPPVQQQVQAPPPPQPPAPSSGADFSGAPRPGALWTQADYDTYMATANRDDRDGKKLSKAIDDGLLVNLGIGRPKKRAGR